MVLFICMFSVCRLVVIVVRWFDFFIFSLVVLFIMVWFLVVVVVMNSVGNLLIMFGISVFGMCVFFNGV